MANEQVNVPSLVLILVLSGLIIRYLFFSSPTPQQPRDSLSALRQREAAVERIQQMFPQVDRRTVLWDLQRNGGNIAATTERILAGRMETPPITFQPPPPPGSTAAASSASGSTAHSQSSSSGAAARPADKPTQPDLIQRYHLQDRLRGDGSGGGVSEDDSNDSSSGSKGKGKGWSSNKDERQSLLHKRREDMILAARRKMEAKIAGEKATSGGSS